LAALRQAFAQDIILIDSDLLPFTPMNDLPGQLVYLRNDDNGRRPGGDA
jgi:hypothetical protein